MKCTRTAHTHGAHAHAHTNTCARAHAFTPHAPLPYYLHPLLRSTRLAAHTAPTTQRYNTTKLTTHTTKIRAAIEQIMVMTAQNILEGKGFAYMVPSRSSSNNLYVPEIDRIVLLDQVLVAMLTMLHSGHTFSSFVSGQPPDVRKH